jgi:tetratricopeptide (TPR) repeat protein
MNEPIPLADRLFIRARRLLDVGQTSAAARLLRRLASQTELRVSLRAVAHQLMGQFELTAQRFRRARRHFAAAIRLQPHDAETYFRYAAAVEADPDGEPRKGWAALRRAVGINAFEPRYWAALGRAALRMGERKRAIRAFRRAAGLRPETVEQLAEIVTGFVSLGRRREAAAILTAARFRDPRNAALQQLQDRFRFERAREAQQMAHRRLAGGSAILPFPGRTAGAGAAVATPCIVRVDRASRPAPHVLRMFGTGPDPRRAQ